MQKLTALMVGGLILYCSISFSQVSISNDGSSPDGSSMLEIKSSSKGFLPPRMTTSQRNQISSPAAGLSVFNTDTRSIDFYDGTSWVTIIPVNNNFTCGQTFTDYRNGAVYGTVLIGNQCWMSQNLNIGTRLNGTLELTNNGILEKYCYNNLESNCSVYGGLYQWGECVQYYNSASNTTTWNPSSSDYLQGICPQGWHLPADYEFTQMTTFLGTEAIAGGKLKEAGVAHWATPNTNGTNTSGFTALPCGYRFTDGSFGLITFNGYFWSMSEYSNTISWYRNLHYNYENVSRGSNSKSNGFAVRCVRNN